MYIYIYIQCQVKEVAKGAVAPGGKILGTAIF
jgi:hypothetical protein